MAGREEEYTFHQILERFVISNLKSIVGVADSQNWNAFDVIIFRGFIWFSCSCYPTKSHL